MSLYSDVAFMLRRSSTASRLQVDRTLQHFKKKLREQNDFEVYQRLDPRVKHNLCCARILQGNYSEWDGWQFRDEWAEAMRYGIKSIPFWDGNYTESLIIIGEQGIGDEVLFSSLIPEAMVRCKKVTYACDGRLVEIIKRSFGIDARERYIDARDDLLGDNTAFIPAADLLPLFRRRPGDFPRRPFIKILKSRVEEFEKYRGRVGLSWRGRHGYISAESFGIEKPISLQYDHTTEEVERPDIDLRNDIEGVLALISVLDKVVCVPTSVMHFAGSIGAKCEIVIPDKKTELEVDKVVDELDWHVPEGPSHVYPNVTVYRDLKSWQKR